MSDDIAKLSTSYEWPMFSQGTDRSEPFLPEEVRKALGADDVNLGYQGGAFWLIVWFGLSPMQDPAWDPLKPSQSVSYQAVFRQVPTTAEAIAAIQKQRPGLSGLDGVML